MMLASRIETRTKRSNDVPPPMTIFIVIILTVALAFLIAGTAVISLIPLYITTNPIEPVDFNRTTVRLTVSFSTNMSNAVALTSPDLSVLSTNMKSILNFDSVEIYSAEFTDTSTIQSRNGICQKSSAITGDIITMELGIRCTPVCLTNRCRQNCLAMIEKRITVEKPDFPIRMKFDDVTAENVYLQFCSFKSVMKEPLPSAIQETIQILLSELQERNTDAILYWNYVTIQTGAYDYDTSLTSRPNQVGPVNNARAYSIIHGAMYDALAVFNSNLKPVFRPPNLPDVTTFQNTNASRAAIMEAAYRTLLSLYPSLRMIFNAVRKDFLTRVLLSTNPSNQIQMGISIGRTVASYILMQRENDGSNQIIEYIPTASVGYHQVDPLNPGQGFFGAHWMNVRSIFMTSQSQFRASNIVGSDAESRLSYLNSSQYLEDYQEVRLVGAKNSTNRTEDQKEIGIFWAYDGAPKIGVPIRLYNQIVRTIALERQNSMMQNAQLMGFTNYALFEASVASWESKYFYNLWRPIVGIRQGTATITPDPTWEPLGAPASGAGIDFTPNFPSYTSGHATFGSAIFESLRLFYKTDDLPFQFQSDEFNGQTIDSSTQLPRPQRIRQFRNLTQAETENKLSRIYLGVHWRIDQEEGQTMGRNVARQVFERFF